MCLYYYMAIYLLGCTYSMAGRGPEDARLRDGAHGAYGRVLQRHAALRGAGPRLSRLLWPRPTAPGCYRRATTVGLRCLAEVYRAARELWPLSSGDASKCVTLRVDRLKAVETAKIVQMYEAGQVWFLKRASDKEGVIELMSLHELPSMIFGKAGQAPRQVLKLWELKDQETLHAAEAAQLLLGQQGEKPSLSPSNLSRAATRRLSNAMLSGAKVAPFGVETPSRRRSA